MIGATRSWSAAFATAAPLRAIVAAISATGAVVVLAAVATAPAGDRTLLEAAGVIAVAAGLSATSVGVFGGVLVPGLLLLGVPPQAAAPASLLLQVLVIPLGATSHAAVGHVKRSIALPLIIGGVIGSVAGALLSSTIPSTLVTTAVAAVIVAIGVMVLASLRGGSTPVAHREEVHPGRIGAIGTVAGFASGISGAGWGPIGVKLLILARLDPRHAVGSSLTGRVFMAFAAVLTYALVSRSGGGAGMDPRLFIVLLGGSAAAVLPGTMLLARIGRRPASAAIAILSIALALPSLLSGGGR